MRHDIVHRAVLLIVFLVVALCFLFAYEVSG
jgi:hypothetical protein